MHRVPTFVWALAALLLAVPASTAVAQAPEFSFTDTTLEYSQDFDSLESDDGMSAAWVDADAASNTLDYWYAEQESGVATLFADNGADTDASLKSLGDDDEAERALGMLAEMTTTDISALGARFENNTGEKLIELQVSFTYEIWRLGDDEITVQVFFRDDNSDDVESFDLQSAATAGWTMVDSRSLGDGLAGGMVDGNLLANQDTVTLTLCVSVDNGDDFWLGWYANPGSSTDSTTWGVDDLTVTVTPLGENPDLLDDDFSSYAAGEGIADTTENPDTLWNDISGGGPIVSSGAVALDWDGTAAEANQQLCPLGEYDITNAGTDDTAVATFNFTVATDGSVGNDSVFLIGGFYDDGETEVVASFWVEKNDTGVWRFHIGTDGTAPDASGEIDTLDVAVGTSYSMMLMIEFDDGDDDSYTVTLAVNPTDESTNGGEATVTLTDPGTTFDANYFALFNDLAADEDGTATLDDLRIGTSFDIAAQQSDVDFTEDSPANSTQLGGASGVLVGQFDVVASPATPNPTLVDLTLTADGTGDSNTDVTNVELWLDDGDGTFDDAVDTAVDGTASYSGGMLTFDVDMEIGSASVTMFVVYDFGTTFTDGETFEFDVTGATILNGSTGDLPIGSAVITASVPVDDPDDDDDDNGGSAFALLLLVLMAGTTLMVIRRR